MSNTLLPKHNFTASDSIKAGRITQANVDQIRSWLKANPNIPELTDEQIVLFLISCNNKIEITTETIAAFYRCRNNSLEFFTERNIDTDDLVKHYRVSLMAVMPKNTPDNNAILYSGLRDSSYSNFNIDQQIKLLFMCLDTVLYTNPPNGLIVIMDMKGIGMMHLTRMKLGSIRKFFAYLQEALPCQLKQIHILNSNYLLDKILQICRPFMKKELMDMINTHPSSMNFSDFHKQFVPASCLSSDLGGQHESLEKLSENIIKKYKEMKTFFELEQKQLACYKKS